jgi:predicted methyltransferase
MAVYTTKYVRKPLYVDAVQVTKENFEEVLHWCQGDIGYIDGSTVQRSDDVTIEPDKQYIRIRVHNPQSPRQTKAFVGDWILYTEKGYKIYTEKAFTENFDPVPETIRAA